MEDGHNMASTEDNLNVRQRLKITSLEDTSTDESISILFDEYILTLIFPQGGNFSVTYLKLVSETENCRLAVLRETRKYFKKKKYSPSQDCWPRRQCK